MIAVNVSGVRIFRNFMVFHTCMYSRQLKATVIIYPPSDLIRPVLPVLQVAFPIQKWPYFFFFSNFVYIFPDIMKKVHIFIFSQM